MTPDQAKELLTLAMEFDVLVRRCEEHPPTGDELVDQAIRTIAIAMAQCERGLLYAVHAVLDLT